MPPKDSKPRDPKITSCMMAAIHNKGSAEINQHLGDQGWIVLRFWESRVLTEPDQIVDEIMHVIWKGREPIRLEQAAKEVGSTAQSDG